MRISALFRTLGVLAFATVAIGCPPKINYPTPPDATPPDQIGIHGEAKGGGLGQDAGLFQAGTAPKPALTIGPGGVLNLLASAGDKESGIQKIRIIGQEKTCKWNPAANGYAQVSFNGAKEWFSQVNSPSSGTVPESTSVQTSVFVANELGNADRLEMTFQTEATNFGNLMDFTAPIAYQSVNATGNSNPGACP